MLRDPWRLAVDQVGLALREPAEFAAGWDQGRRSYPTCWAPWLGCAKLVTMIHLARFSGAAAGRVEELVGQIAATGEGLSEVSHWRENSSASN